MRFFLLGASGFLGRHIHAGLTQLPDADVVTASRSAAGYAASHRLVDLSRITIGDLAEVLAEDTPDIVVNAAGLTVGEPDELVASNVCGVATLVAAMIRACGRVRLVHLGSAAEYGRVAVGTRVTENAPTRPTTVYGATKLDATHRLLAARARGLDAVVLRVFNAVGPGAPPTTLPGRVASEMRRSQNIQLGRLTGWRDFVDTRDVADAVVAAALSPVLTTGVLNVGSGLATPVRTVVEELVSIAAFTGRVREAAAGVPRAEQTQWQQADVDTIRNSLGWRPQRSLTTSLSDLWWEGQRQLEGAPRRSTGARLGSAT